MIYYADNKFCVMNDIFQIWAAAVATRSELTALRRSRHHGMRTELTVGGLIWGGGGVVGVFGLGIFSSKLWILPPLSNS